MLLSKHKSQSEYFTLSVDEKHSFGVSHLAMLIFPLFVVAFYAFLFLYIKPVDGIHDDWGIYSTLSGAYLGYPDAHVPFLLYPLSWLLSKLYMQNSGVPWYGLLQHGVHICCIWLLYHRTLHLWKKHSGSDAVFWPALSILGVLFFLVDFNAICEVQYTTTAGFAAATALFYFITTKADEGALAFLLGNVPTFLLSWLAFGLCRNVLFMMLPIAGMLWLSKWLLSNQRFYSDYFIKLLIFAGILLLGMGILYVSHRIAYSGEEWSDFIKINYYREQVDFYTWPEYEECSRELKLLGMNEATYHYMQNGAPYTSYQMSLEDWEQIHRIAKKSYYARTSVKAQLKSILTGSLAVFFYHNGMQPLNLGIAILLLTTLLLILYNRNLIALAVYLFYLAGRMVTWGCILYEGSFPKRIMQPLIAADFMVLSGILYAFNLFRFRAGNLKIYAVLLPCIVLLSVISVCCTKTDIDANYHVNQDVWDDLKEYCHSHPDNFYIWTRGSGTLDNYCESPFDTELDAYDNFFYTDWGIAYSPNSSIKLARHGIENLGEDLVENENVYFIFAEGLYSKEHPAIMYFRDTYEVRCELTDRFMAGGKKYEVYQLR